MGMNVCGVIMDVLLVPYGMVSKILLGDGSYHGNWSVKRSNESSFVLYDTPPYSLGLIRGKENSYTNHHSHRDKLVDLLWPPIYNKQKKNINACLYVYFLVHCHMFYVKGEKAFDSL